MQDEEIKVEGMSIYMRRERHKMKKKDVGVRPRRCCDPWGINITCVFRVTLMSNRH